MHQPGIEPGSVPWQGTILPLDHWCLLFTVYSKTLENSSIQRTLSKGTGLLHAAISSGNQMSAKDPTSAYANFFTAQNAPAGNRTRVCTVAGYYSTTRPLVLVV
ncbi:hypothetical protein N665_0020s0120 [Sinapis alba]|nr:hypothetical protein N665_0020s0120 [Sinapis alba]